MTERIRERESQGCETAGLREVLDCYGVTEVSARICCLTHLAAYGRRHRYGNGRKSSSDSSLRC
jgi:uncharacterized small protein (DUF1192 family)